jgi:hypothetical protein
MITNEDILSLNYYNYGNPFTGSFRGMRYRIIKQKETRNEEGAIVTEGGLLVTVWPEPFAFDKTDESLKVSRLFPFDEEGKSQAVAWLNEEHERRQL